MTDSRPRKSQRMSVSPAVPDAPAIDVPPWLIASTGDLHRKRPAAFDQGNVDDDSVDNESLDVRRVILFAEPEEGAASSKAGSKHGKAIEVRSPFQKSAAEKRAIAEKQQCAKIKAKWGVTLELAIADSLGHLSSPTKIHSPSIRPSNAPAVVSSTGSSTPRHFSVATYNIWFGLDRDNGHPHGAARMQAMVDELLRCESPDNPLWFIGLQEVTPGLARTLFPALERVGYVVIHQEDAPYGVALAVKQQDAADGSPCPVVLDFGWKDFSRTVMQRGFLFVRVRLPGSENSTAAAQCIVTTTHLESYMPATERDPVYTGSEQRHLQLEQMQEFCHKEMARHRAVQTVILTGDMNWDDERKTPFDKPLLGYLPSTQNWKDAWLTSQLAKDKGYTYDGKLNPMLGSNLRRRFDRCLVHTNAVEDAATEIISTLMIGKLAIPNLTWQKYNSWKQTYKETPTAPSDHFGLVTQLRYHA
jgi:exonuclease III